MHIGFYEEFPNEKNLKKLKLIKFKTRLFIAAKSVKEFQKFEKQAKKIKKNVEVAYWPIVKNSYWISPFANTKDLIELFKELEKIENPLLIDLELPLKKRWRMYFKNIFHFKTNKRLIKEFLEKNKSRITTAEYPFAFISKIMRLLGLNYTIDVEKSIMWYSSMISKPINKKIKNNLKKIKNKKNYSISLGTLAIGILGNEPILSSKKLEKDLEFVKKAGFKKIIIFRLEGINKKYLKVLNKFT
ncbi:hypothetical protein KAI04_02055 [Candidatus Pacearchaeota archaeon]|nr:hypothetical protein [Candidatus Pacearchaeota archaeon]